MRRATVFASATRNRTLDRWVIAYQCWGCRGQHHDLGGTLDTPPHGGPRRSPCGETVHVVVRDIEQ